MNDLAKRIEAILFIHGEPITIDRLVKILGVDKIKVRQAAEELDHRLIDTALTLVWRGDALQLATRPALAKDAETLVKDEVSREISRATSETLAIIAYRGSLTRAEIDYIRGVNSSYTLRNLLIRGLVARYSNPKDARTYIYQVSLDFLKFLGLGKIEDLPEYAEFTQKISQFLADKPAEN